MRSQIIRWTGVGLLAFVGIGAIPAGYSFVADPSGSDIGIPESMREMPVFDDFLIPGTILFGLGALYLWSALVEAMGWRCAWFGAGLSGGAMIVWILVQFALMGYTRHPVQTALQTTILAIGLAVGALALVQLWETRRPAHGVGA